MLANPIPGLHMVRMRVLGKTCGLSLFRREEALLPFCDLASTTTLLAITFGWIYRNRAPTAGRVVRAYIKAMPNSNFVVIGPTAAGFAFSPDGRQHCQNSADPPRTKLSMAYPMPRLIATPGEG